MSLFFNIITTNNVTSFEWCHFPFIEIAIMNKSAIKTGSSLDLMSMVRMSNQIISYNVHHRVKMLFNKYNYKEHKTLIEMAQYNTFFDSCNNYIFDYYTRNIIQDVPDILRDLVSIFEQRKNINCYTVPKCGKSTYSLLLYSRLPLKTIIITDDENLEELYIKSKDRYDSAYNNNLRISHNTNDITDEKIVIFDNIIPIPCDAQTVIFNNKKSIDNNFILNTSFGLSIEIINLVNFLFDTNIKHTSSNPSCKLPIFIYTHDYTNTKQLCIDKLNETCQTYNIIDDFNLYEMTRICDVLIILSKKHINEYNYDIKELNKFMHILT